MHDPSSEDRRVDLAALRRALRLIGWGWLIGVVVSIVPAVNVPVGAALVLIALVVLRSGLDHDLVRRCDELIALAAIAMVASIAAFVSGIGLLQMVAPLVATVAAVRFALLMSRVTAGLGDGGLARRWQSTARALLGIASVIVGLLLLAVVSAWAGRPAIGFADHAAFPSVYGRPLELTALGTVILVAIIATFLVQLVLLNRVFHPTRLLLERRAEPAAEVHEPAPATPGLSSGTSPSA